MHGSAFLGSASAIASQGVPVFARRCFCVRNRLQPFATVCNRLQPFATVRRSQVACGAMAETLTFGGFCAKDFCASTCNAFAFGSSVFWCIAWPCVTLALQNMPPKARAPEARMAFEWGQVSGVKFCTCSGPSRCLPTVCKKWVKECFHIFLHLDLPTLYSATYRRHPMLCFAT